MTQVTNNMKSTFVLNLPEITKTVTKDGKSIQNVKNHQYILHTKQPVDVDREFLKNGIESNDALKAHFDQGRLSKGKETNPLFFEKTGDAVPDSSVVRVPDNAISNGNQTIFKSEPSIAPPPKGGRL